MMKRILALLLAMLLICSVALAEPRYPASKASVSDNAAVLSAAATADLNTFTRKLSKLRLYVVTVDFLDGESISAYGEGLRKNWKLDDDDLLLLMAVGEDKYGFFPGKNTISQAVLDKLLAAHFDQPFLRQDYDGAVSALMPALAEEISKASGQALDMTGLFGITAADPAASAEEWMNRVLDKLTAFGETVDHTSKEQKKSSTGVGKIILTVLLLLVIFGNHKSKRYHHGRRGCLPFSSLLAIFGLFTLWKKK